jgi:hypothetical protein
MANRYWVGGTADWDATAGTKWSTTSGGAGGSAVPTSSDDVFFDANSGAVTVTVISSNMKNLDFSGFTGTLAGSASLDCRGSLVVSSGMTYSHTGDLSFGATSGTQTITTNGKTLTSQISFVGVGGTWQLSDSLTTTNSAGITLTDGTFNANNFDVTCVKFNSSNSNTRTLTMGSGTFTITGTGTAWDFGTVTNLTLTANTSTVKFTSAVATSMRFDGGGKTYYNIWHAGGTGTNNALEMFGSNTFNNIKLNAGTYMDFNGSTTQTVSSLTMIGTAGSNCFLRSFNTTVYTISDTSGTNTVQYCNISYCTASGGATFNATNSTDGGNNTGWNFISLTTNLVSYWKLDESSGNAVDSVGSNTLTNTNTVTYSSGVINNGANFVEASSQKLSITDASQSGLDFTGNMTLAGWVKFTAGGGTQKNMIGKDNGASTGYAFYWESSGNQLIFFYKFNCYTSGSFVDTIFRNMVSRCNSLHLIRWAFRFLCKWFTTRNTAIRAFISNK